MNILDYISDTFEYRNERREFYKDQFDVFITQVLNIPVKHRILFYLGIISLLSFLHFQLNQNKIKNPPIDHTLKTSFRFFSQEELIQITEKRIYFLILGALLILLSCIPL